MAYRTPPSTRKRSRGRSSRSRSRGRTMSRTTSAIRSGRKRVRGGYAPSVSQSAVDALIDIASSPNAAGVARAASTYKKGYDMRRAAGKVIRTGYVAGKNAGRLTLRRKKPSLMQSIAKKGITNNFEYRKSFQAGEAIAIGHTTLPSKISLHNLMRALVKFIVGKLGIQIQDFGRKCVGNGLAVNDEIGFAYYSTDDINNISLSSVQIAANTTFDGIATEFTAAIINNAGRTQLRFESLRATTAHCGILNCNLSNAKIYGCTKSVLKVQNVTVETTADNESDDVNAVPLQGKIYGCKGNNFLKKQNNTVLHGAFVGGNEEAIVGLYSKQNGTQAYAQALEFYAAGAGPTDSTETTFYKPSEPPKKWEVMNCYSLGNVSLDPGEIKESVLTQFFGMSLQFYYNLLVQRDQVASTSIRYNNDQGKCNVIYLEKTVGRPSTTQNSINIWAQLDFTQMIEVKVKPSYYTAPIQYQRDWT